LVPQAGCNVASIRYCGIELLKQAPTLTELRGFRYGVPILYPTPGRVADGRFMFGKRTFCFPADAELGVIHGIANLAAWQVEDAESAGSATEITCRLSFAPGFEHFDWFPVTHDLRQRIRISPNSIRWEYELDNSAGDEAIPFGYGLHPWFLYQGARDDTWLSLATTEKEELNDGMATGKRVPLADGGSTAIQRFCVGGRVMDDVYCVSAGDQPTTIEFGVAHLSLSLHASQEFTHLVAYTPPREPWFCVENWTCPPDAHNLYARGLERQSCLQVVEPGGKCSGWMELTVADR
jgi:aldose 1-epimerase